MARFESCNEALRACVIAAGGSKVVGAKVFPEKEVDRAQRHLLNCLDEDRAERLTPAQTVLIARLAREVGCHAYMEYLSDTLAYAEPRPVDPAEIADEVRREVVALQRELLAKLDRLERLDIRAAAPRRVA